MKTLGFVMLLGSILVGAVVVTAKSPADDPGRNPFARDAEQDVSVTPTSSAKDQPQEQAVDQMLKNARNGIGAFMFIEHATSKTESRDDLVITSARGVNGTPQQVRIRPGTTTIFRADASRDDFTRSGGWYWRCGETEGQARFKTETQDNWPNSPPGAGALIRVVYQKDGTVHWYRLSYDFRC